MKNYNYLILLFVLLLSFNLTAQQNSEEVTAASRTAEKLNEASNSTTIISEKEISSKKSFNVLSLLEGTVGVNVSRQGVNSFNVSLREGVDVFSTRTVLLSDGRELNTYGLNFFDASKKFKPYVFNSLPSESKTVLVEKTSTPSLRETLKLLTPCLETLTPTVPSNKLNTLKDFLLEISFSEMIVVELLASLSFSAVLEAAVTSSLFC